MKNLMLLVLCAVTVCASANDGSKIVNNKSEWLSSKLYGNDNDMASLREVRIYQKNGKYRVFIKNQFKFDCELEFGKNGNPAFLKNCKSTDKVYNNEPWIAKEKVIKFYCFKTKKEHICRAPYTLVNGNYADKSEFTIAKRR